MKKLFPHLEVIVTKNFDVHQDWEVPIPGFFVLASNRKIRSICEFTDEESADFMNILRKIRKGMYDVLNVKDVYLYQNEDSEHGFNLWIFPRYDWMEQFGIKIQSVRPIIDYAKENMVNEKVFIEVKEYAQKMKKYMKEF
jgi:diadenosine tetraphosphate (Ap4A) HIT family hydrolase